METYFLSSYSSEGFTDFTHEVLNHLDHIYYLQDSSIDKIYQKLNKKKETIEIILDPIDVKSIQGIIFPNKKVGLLKNELMCYDDIRKKKELKNPQSNKAPSNIVMKELTIMNEQIEKKIHETLDKFSEAGDYHRRIKAIYEHALDEKAYHQVYEKLLSMIENKMILRNTESSYSHDLLPDHLFVSAITYEGPIHLYYKFMSDIPQKIILKGNIGSRKSKLLEDIADNIIEKGYRVIKCHCPFEPSELDMIVIPKLGVMLLDGEKPHEIETFHPKQLQIDLSDQCIGYFSLLKEANELKENLAKYKQLMRQGTLCLQDVKKMRDNQSFVMKQYYNTCGDRDLNHFLIDLQDDLSG